MSTTIENVGGTFRIDAARKDLLHASILGVDILFTFRGGQQILAKQLAIQAAAAHPPVVAFADSNMSSAALFNMIGKANDPAFVNPATSATKPPVEPETATALDKRAGSESKYPASAEDSRTQAGGESPAASDAVRANAQKMPVSEAAKNQSAPSLQTTFSEAPLVRQSAPPDLTQTPTSKGSDGGDSDSAGKTSPGTPVTNTPLGSALQAGGGMLPVNLALLNKVGISRTGSTILGQTGAAGSDTDPSFASQAARQIISGAGADHIVANDPSLVGNGFIKVIRFSIDTGTYGNVAISGIKLSGLPADFDVVGAVKQGGEWLIAGNSMTANYPGSVSVVVKYNAVADSAVLIPGQVFNQFVMHAVVAVTDGTVSGTVTRDYGAQVREVSNAGDLNVVDPGGNQIFIFPARGVGSEIVAVSPENTITGGIGADVIYGGSGNDTVIQSGNSDTIAGGGGVNTYDASASLDLDVKASPTNSSHLQVRKAAYAVDDLSNMQRVIAGGGSNSFDLTGSTADGTIVLTSLASTNVVKGGGGVTGYDASALNADISIGPSNGVLVVNKTGGGIDTLTNIDVITTGAGNDRYVASNLQVTFDGKGGSNTYDASQIGADLVIARNGVTGTEFSVSKSGADTDTARNVGTFLGGSGADRFVASGIGTKFDGGDGQDTYDLSGASAGVQVDLAAATDTDGYWQVSNGFGATDSLKNIQSLIGSGHADSLSGDQSANTLNGGLGSNTLTGGGGDDTFRISNAAAMGDIDQVTDLAAGDILDVLTGARVNAALTSDWTATALSRNKGTATLIGNHSVDLSATTGNTAGWTINADGANAVTLKGSDRNDTLTGGAAGDTFLVDAGADTITDIGRGADTLKIETGAAATGILTGAWTATAESYNKGTATLTGNHNVDLSATTGNTAGWTLDAAGANAVALTGSEQSDTLSGGNGNDQLAGGGGNDSFIVTAGTDTITDFGTGTDILQVLGGAASVGLHGSFTADASSYNQGTATLTGNHDVDLSGVDAVKNTAGWTVNAAGANAVTLVGSSQGDTLGGGNGNDTLTGGAGADRFNVTAGTDTLTDLGNSDSLTVAAGATANAALAGTWTATAATSNDGTATVTANGHNTDIALASGANGWTLTNAGNGDGVSLTGSANADTIIGGAGADVLTGHGGNDTLTGGDSADTFVVDAGTDTLADLGHGGADVVQVSAGAVANATLATTWQATAATSNAGTFNIATNGNDADLSKASGPNGYALTETSGTDVSIKGSRYNDTLTGGSGNDTLTGGGGSNTLTGGMGDDTFTVAGTASATGQGTDTITDFMSGNAGAPGGVDYDLVHVLAGGTATLQLANAWVADVYSDNSGSVTVLTQGHDADVRNAVTSASAQWTLDNRGSAVAVTLIGSANADTLIGGSGADTFYVKGGSDTITNLGDGVDILRVTSAAATATATLYDSWTATSQTYNQGQASIDVAGHDIDLANVAGPNGYTISNEGNATAVHLIGSSYADTLTGGNGNDVLTGGGGVDTFNIKAGSDTITDLGYVGVGVGVEVIGIDAGASGTITLGGNWVASASSYANGNATLDAHGKNVDLTAISGTSGWNLSNDLTGAAGASTIIGSARDDTFTVKAQNDTLNGGAGNDTFNVTSSPAAHVVINGGGDVDRVDFTQVSGPLTVNLNSVAYKSVGANSASFGASQYTLTGVEHVLGVLNESNTFYGDTGDANLQLTGGNLADRFVLISPLYSHISAGGQQAATYDTLYLDAANLGSFDAFVGKVDGIEMYDYRGSSTNPGLIGTSNFNGLSINIGNIVSLVGAGGTIIIRGDGNNADNSAVRDEIQFASGAGLSSPAYSDAGQWVQLTLDGATVSFIPFTYAAGGVIRTVLVEEVMNIKSATFPPSLIKDAGGNSADDFGGEPVWLMQGTSAYLGGLQLAAQQIIKGSHDASGTPTSADSLYFKVLGVSGGTLAGTYALPSSIGGSGFTQTDLNNLRVNFVSDGSAAASITFVLSDGINIESLANQHTVEFTVLDPAALAAAGTWGMLDAGATSVDGVAQSVWQDATLRFAASIGAQSTPDLTHTTVTSLSYVRPSDRPAVISDILVGANVATTFKAGDGKQIVIGRSGYANTYDASSATGAITLNMANIDAYGYVVATNDGYGYTDAMKNIVNVVGGSGNDVFTTSASGGNTFTGNGGADTFNITNGSNTVTDLGTGGSDVVTVNAGATLAATVSTNWVAGSGSYNQGTATLTGNVSMDLSAARSNASNTAAWTLNAAGSNAVTLTGSGQADMLTGGSGNDTINVPNLNFANANGGAGHDILQFSSAVNVVTTATTTDGVNFSYRFVDANPVSNLERISLANGQTDRLTLSYKQVLGMLANGNYLSSSLAGVTSNVARVIEIDADATDSVRFLTNSIATAFASVGTGTATDSRGTFTGSVWSFADSTPGNLGGYSYVIVRGTNNFTLDRFTPAVSTVATSAIAGGNIRLGGLDLSGNALTPFLSSVDAAPSLSTGTPWNLTNSEIIYTVTATPANAALQYTSGGLTTALAVGSTFTQDDINNSRVTVNASALSDSGTGGSGNFSFVVSDGGNFSAVKTETVTLWSLANPNGTGVAAGNYLAAAGSAGYSFTVAAGSSVTPAGTYTSYAGNGFWNWTVSKSNPSYAFSDTKSTELDSLTSKAGGLAPVLVFNAQNVGAAANGFTSIANGAQIAGTGGTAWTDLISGIGLSSVGTSQARYNTAAFGGRGGVVFDGSVDLRATLTSAIGGASSPNGLTIFFISETPVWSSNTPWGTFALGNYSGGAYGVNWGPTDAGATGSARGYESAAALPNTSYSASVNALVYEDGTTQPNTALYLNGVLSNYAKPGSSSGLASTTTLDLGKTPGISGTGGFAGTIGEMVVFNGALTPSQVQAVSNYLALQWGFAFNNSANQYAFGPYSYVAWKDANITVGSTAQDTLTAKGLKPYDTANPANPNNSLVSDVLVGGDGNDTLKTGAGNDVVLGGTGSSTVTISNGNDVILFGTSSYNAYNTTASTDGLVIDTTNRNANGFIVVNKAGDGKSTGAGASHLVGTDLLWNYGYLLSVIAGSGDDTIVADGDIYPGLGNNTVTLPAVSATSRIYLTAGSTNTVSSANGSYNNAPSKQTVYIYVDHSDLSKTVQTSLGKSGSGSVVTGENLFYGGAGHTNIIYDTTAANATITYNGNLAGTAIYTPATGSTQNYWAINYSQTVGGTPYTRTVWTNVAPTFGAGTFDVTLGAGLAVFSAGGTAAAPVTATVHANSAWGTSRYAYVSGAGGNWVLEGGSQYWQASSIWRVADFSHARLATSRTDTSGDYITADKLFTGGSSSETYSLMRDAAGNAVWTNKAGNLNMAGVCDILLVAGPDLTSTAYSPGAKASSLSTLGLYTGVGYYATAIFSGSYTSALGGAIDPATGIAAATTYTANWGYTGSTPNELITNTFVTALGADSDYAQISISQLANSTIARFNKFTINNDASVSNQGGGNITGGAGIDTIHIIAGTSTAASFDLNSLGSTTSSGSGATISYVYSTPFIQFEVLDFSSDGLNANYLTSISANVVDIRRQDMNNGLNGASVMNTIPQTPFSLKLNAGTSFTVTDAASYDVVTTAHSAWNGLTGTLYTYYVQGSAHASTDWKGAVHVVTANTLMDGVNGQYLQGDYLQVSSGALGMTGATAGTSYLGTNILADFSRSQGEYDATTNPGGDYQTHNGAIYDKITDSHANTFWANGAGVLDFSHATGNVALVFGSGVTDIYGDGSNVTAKVLGGGSSDTVVVSGSYTSGGATYTAMNGGADVAAAKLSIKTDGGNDTVQVNVSQLNSGLATNAIDGGIGGVDTLKVVHGATTFDLGNLVVTASQPAKNSVARVANFEIFDFSDGSAANNMSVTTTCANLMALDYTNPTNLSGGQLNSDSYSTWNPLTIKLDSGDTFTISNVLNNVRNRYVDGVTDTSHTFAAGGFDERVTTHYTANGLEGTLYQYYSPGALTIIGSVHVVGQDAYGAWGSTTAWHS